MARNTLSGTYVTVGIAGTPLKYGFNSRLRDALRNDFGQVEITGTTSIQNLIIGANIPKPSRASKRFVTGYDSSYCDPSKIKSLRDDRYRITPGRGLGAGSAGTGLSKTFYVTINGIKYAWNSAVPSADQTGVNSSQVSANLASGDTDLVFGANFPKPPRLQIAVGESKDHVFSSFADPSAVDNALNAGWTRSGGRKGDGSYTEAHFSARFGS